MAAVDVTNLGQAASRAPENSADCWAWEEMNLQEMRKVRVELAIGN